MHGDGETGVLGSTAGGVTGEPLLEGAPLLDPTETGLYCTPKPVSFFKPSFPYPNAQLIVSRARSSGSTAAPPTSRAIGRSSPASTESSEFRE